MGKLTELREKLLTLDYDHPDVPEIQKEINRIEQWCIDNDKGYIKSLTVWGKTNSDSQLYPWHVGVVYLEDIYMVGALNGKGINYEHDGKIHICDYCNSD